MSEKMESVSKVVFLDVSAAFRRRDARPTAYLWGNSSDFDDFAEQVKKNSPDHRNVSDLIRQWAGEKKNELGYYEFIKEVIHAWSEAAVSRFAQALHSCGARFVLTSSLRARFGRDAMATLFSYHGISDLFGDMTATPEPLFSRLVTCRSDEGAVPSDYLPRYRRMMREIWHRLDEESGGGVCHRAVEIREYLDRHPEIASYVVIDSHHAMAGLPQDRQLTCADAFSEADAVRVRDLLGERAEIPRLPESCRGPELDLFRETCILGLYRRWRDPAVSGLARY